MSHEPISHWVENAKGNKIPKEQNAYQAKANMIMEIAERIRPWISKMFENVRDENGMLVQPSRIRGIALNVAQRIVREQEARAGA